MCSLSATQKDAQTHKTCEAQKCCGCPEKYGFTVNTSSSQTLWLINSIKQGIFNSIVLICYSKSSENLRSACFHQLLFKTMVRVHHRGRSFLTVEHKDSWPSPSMVITFLLRDIQLLNLCSCLGFSQKFQAFFCILMSHCLNEASKWTQSIGAFFFVSLSWGVILDYMISQMQR